MSDELLMRVLAAVEGLQGEMGGLKAEMAGLKAEMAGLKAEMVELKVRMDRMEARMDRMEARVERMDARLERVETNALDTRTDIMLRIDRLQDTVSGITDDVRVNFARADRAAKVADPLREEVRALAAEVVAMERQILRLQTEVRDLRGGGH